MTLVINEQQSPHKDEPIGNIEIDTFFDQAKPMENESEETHEQRKATQKEVFKTVQFSDLVIASKEALEAEDQFRKGKGDEKPLERGEVIKQVRGAIFERLSQEEYQLKEKRSATKLSKSILEIYRNPPEALEDAIGNMRNPDLIDIREEGDGLVIKGAAEVKLGLLNTRAYEQIVDFEDSLATLIETLREFKRVNFTLEGFEDLIEASDTLKVRSGNLERIIMVPANRDTSNIGTLLDERDFRKYDMEWAMEDMVLDILPESDLRESSFSIEDVGTLTQEVLNSL